MAEIVEHPLKKVGLRILEDWAMMIVDEVSETECGFNPDEKLYMAWINIHGHISGALSIITQTKFIQSLASNLLGVEPSDAPSRDECEDALREMGNVLAGNYFTEAYGEDVVFDLINPNVTEVPFEELAKVASRRVKYYFQADDAPVVITFSIRE